MILGLDSSRTIHHVAGICFQREKIKAHLHIFKLSAGEKNITTFLICESNDKTGKNVWHKYVASALRMEIVGHLSDSLQLFGFIKFKKIQKKIEMLEDFLCVASPFLGPYLLLCRVFVERRKNCDMFMVWSRRRRRRRRRRSRSADEAGRPWHFPTATKKPNNQETASAAAASAAGNRRRRQQMVSLLIGSIWIPSERIFLGAASFRWLDGAIGRCGWFFFKKIVSSVEDGAEETGSICVSGTGGGSRGYHVGVYGAVCLRRGCCCCRSSLLLVNGGHERSRPTATAAAMTDSAWLAFAFGS